MPNNAAEPKWLSAAEIVQLNQIAVAKTEEAHFLMSEDLLSSATARPRNLYLYENEQDLIVLAVRLIEAVGQNHCFEQGNKRTAYYAGITFLEINNVYLDIPDTIEKAKFIEDVITRAKHPSELIAYLRTRSF